MSLTTRLKYCCALSFAAIAFVLSSSTPARAQGAVFACVNSNNGNVRIVSATEACRNSETRVQWALAGQPGPTGATGATGANGANGANGATGAAGAQGSQGVVGPTGPQGVQGDTGSQGPQGAQGPAATFGSIIGQLESCVPNFNFNGLLVHIPGRAFSVFTDANGHFQIDNVPPGTYSLRVEGSSGALATVANIAVADVAVTLDSHVLISDTSSDANNCGACNVACQAGATCTAGQCGAPACVPTPEICDGIDNDCDGNVDDNVAGVGGLCNTGMPGTCSVGVTVCGAAGGIQCLATAQPTAEICDGIDNDCDGQTDEGNPSGGQACNTGQVGICTVGITVCSNGALTCNATQQPSAETCNGLDDNCDGAVDNGIPLQACYTGPVGTSGVGICRTGNRLCSNGAFGACVGQVLPNAEVCDGLDNDCDGSLDEGVTQSCYTGPAGTNGVGACHAGTQVCTTGVFGSCVGQVTPIAEVCGNAIDDDCDGQINEGCVFEVLASFAPVRQ